MGNNNPERSGELSSSPWPQSPPALAIRLARADDVPALEALIPLAVRVLQAPYYAAAQIKAALGPVFGVDRQLISDGTYFAVEHCGGVVGCGAAD